MDRHDGPSKELGFEVSQTRQKEAHWRLRLREDDGGGRQDWWFASTAIPLIAAAIAPAANVFSIAALVSTWRASLYDYETHMVLEPFNGIEIPDPHWVIGTNVTSLICGYLGNISLFLNFTNRVPYILALPVTVVLWYISFAVVGDMVHTMIGSQTLIRHFPAHWHPNQYGRVCSARLSRGLYSSLLVWRHSLRAIYHLRLYAPRQYVGIFSRPLS